MGDKLKLEQERNKELIQKYPWLKPRNPLTMENIDNFDYSYTMLDDMPDGWRKTFGMLMVEEIDKELKKLGDKRRDEYYIFDIKEKYGGLRWYDVGGTKEIDDIIDKYSTISEHVCIECGKPDVPLLTRIGWIIPLCKECYESKKHYKRKYEDTYDHSLSNKIKNEYTRIKFVPHEKNERIKCDITETVNAVRDNYNNNLNISEV